MSTPATVPFSFTLSRDPVHHFVRGRWAGPRAEPLVFRHYAAILAESCHEPNCRFWLLDMRGSTWPSERFEHWFSRVMAPLVAHDVGHPLFVACVLDPDHLPAITTASSLLSQRVCADHDLYPCFFDDEAAARDWLLHQMSLDVEHTAVKK